MVGRLGKEFALLQPPPRGWLVPIGWVGALMSRGHRDHEAKTKPRASPSILKL